MNDSFPVEFFGGCGIIFLSKIYNVGVCGCQSKIKTFFLFFTSHCMCQRCMTCNTDLQLSKWRDGKNVNWMSSSQPVYNQPAVCCFLQNMSEQGPRDSNSKIFLLTASCVKARKFLWLAISPSVMLKTNDAAYRLGVNAASRTTSVHVTLAIWDKKYSSVLKTFLNTININDINLSKMTDMVAHRLPHTCDGYAWME